MPADAAAEWASKWLRNSKLAAKSKHKKHTGTTNIAKPEFVLAVWWLGAGSDSWRRELPPVVPGTEPLFVFKPFGWHTVNSWLLLAKLSHKICLLGQEEHDLFIYYLFTLFWYLETLGQDPMWPDCIHICFSLVDWYPLANSTLNSTYDAQHYWCSPARGLFFSTKEQENASPKHTSDWTENNFSKSTYFESGSFAKDSSVQPKSMNGNTFFVWLGLSMTSFAW